MNVHTGDLIAWASTTAETKPSRRDSTNEYNYSFALRFPARIVSLSPVLPRTTMTQTVPTIYLVDDDPAVRDSLRTMLEAFGMSVRDYASAKAFLADPYRNKRGCLVLDLHMPKWVGSNCSTACGNKVHSLPVIVFTGRGDANLREHVERVEPSRCLPSP